MTEKEIIVLLMKTIRRTTITLLLCLTTLFSLSACHSTPVSPGKIPEPPPEGPEASPTVKTEPPIEPEAPAIQAEVPSKPGTVPIPRVLPESIIGIPEKDLASRRLEYNTTISSRPAEPPHGAGWQYRNTRQGHIVGFEFSNYGGNRILPPRRDAAKNQFFTRDFQFRFDERARQDIHLMVTDWVPSRDRQFRLSELMNSLMHFFPRNYLPAIVNLKNRNLVTLPTGEEAEFDAKTNEILSGVLSETPVDLNPDRAARKFPGVDYHGKGVMVRVNARGTDPRIGTTAIITTGTPPQDCDKGIDCALCLVPSRELWDQTGAVRFKFSTDQDFDRFLITRCGFGLPKIGIEFKVASPLQ
jgi:hypothetical protein